MDVNHTEMSRKQSGKKKHFGSPPRVYALISSLDQNKWMSSISMWRATKLSDCCLPRLTIMHQCTLYVQIFITINDLTVVKVWTPTQLNASSIAHISLTFWFFFNLFYVTYILIYNDLLQLNQDVKMCSRYITLKST